MRLAPLLILLLPILEIAAFIVVGDAIGVLATLGLVVVTAVVGILLVRMEGLRLLAGIRSDLDAGRMPAEKLIGGAALAVAGLLFLIPGFITDAAGLLLVLPPFRRALAGWVRRHSVVTTSAWQSATRGRHRAEPGVVDLDPEDYADSPRPDSPWAEDCDRDPGDRPAIGPR